MRYRLLFLKPDRGAEQGMQFDRADDEQAINFVLGIDDDGAKELWCGSRRVSRFRERSIERPSAGSREFRSAQRP